MRTPNKVPLIFGNSHLGGGGGGRGRAKGSPSRASQKHISKNSDRDIPYKPPYKEAR